MGKAKDGSDRGRPTVMTDQVVSKLEQAFIMGCSDVEACLYANISKQSLYDYCKIHPDFSDRKEELKKTPLMKARININEAILDGDKDMSKWYAERKAKTEFSTKVEQQVDANVNATVGVTIVDDIK